tara:strand:+ start:3777 stop:4883 length:1107 start_codon:yes stop_codon:yes gene_type:complete
MRGQEFPKLDCQYAGKCSGCPWYELPYSEQQQRKIKALEPYTVDAFHPVAPYGLRERMDISLFEGKLGLYDFAKKDLVDIQECQQVVPELNHWIHDFRKQLPPVRLGSFRLRIGINGQRGIWMDIPNVDIKKLLEEKTYLMSMMNEGVHIELGQKRKALLLKGEELKLQDDIFYPWFSTYQGEDFQPLPLFSKVGDFSQSGQQANKIMMQVLSKMLFDLPVQNISELCSGIGNFSFFMASLGYEVDAHEWNLASLKACEKTLETFSEKAKIKFHRTNIHANNLEFTKKWQHTDLVLADPPRSGLGKFVDLFANYEAPKYFIYASCFAETFKKDLEALKRFGYKLKRLDLVDQFPQSKHVEAIGLLLQD